MADLESLIAAALAEADQASAEGRVKALFEGLQNRGVELTVLDPLESLSPASVASPSRIRIP